MKVEFVIPTYERTDLLMACISSIVGQTNPNWKIHVVADGPSEEVKEQLSRIAGYYEDDDRIKWTVLDERYNDWGHTPRNIGLAAATEEWIVMTGEDNYYTPIFVDEFLKVGASDKTIAMHCNMVHNWVKQDYIPISCELHYGKIDIGNFVFRRKFAGNLRLITTYAQSDWAFVERYMQINSPFGEAVKIDKILYVHN
jgi:glycosyltransferase involved in cell wall biosynthesis